MLCCSTLGLSLQQPGGLQAVLSGWGHSHPNCVSFAKCFYFQFIFYFKAKMKFSGFKSNPDTLIWNIVWVLFQKNILQKKSCLLCKNCTFVQIEETKVLRLYTYLKLHSLIFWPLGFCRNTDNSDILSYRERGSWHHHWTLFHLPLLLITISHSACLSSAFLKTWSLFVLFTVHMTNS